MFLKAKTRCFNKNISNNFIVNYPEIKFIF